MQPQPRTTGGADPGRIAPVSRRALLQAGAAAGLSALAGAYSLKVPAARAARAGVVRIDEGAIRSRFEQTAKSLLTPGAVMILRTPADEVLADYGSGVLGRTTKIGPRDFFRIGSVTKTFTGTVILQLAQHGDLDLDHPVSRYQPDVPNGEHISIEQLLTMRSGLYNFTESLQLNEIMDHDPTPSFTASELLSVAYRARPEPVPGKRFEYSNTNTVLLGVIAEQLDGGPLAEIFKRRLFQRLGIRDTLMPGITSSSIPRPHPRGYMYGTNVSTLETEKLPLLELAAALAGALKPNDVTDANPSWAGAAGAAISTGDDMARWARALCDGSLLNPAWQRRRLDSIRSVDPGNPGAAGYGLAIAKFGELYGHRRTARLSDVRRLRPEPTTHPHHLGQPQSLAARTPARRHDRPAAHR